MNAEIENIQKNMQTVFKGFVNGRQFTNRNEMNAYIGECISNGTPITNLSYSTTARLANSGTATEQPAGQQRSAGREAIRNAQRAISWITYINDLNHSVPEPYDTVIGYVVPFVREDINITESNADFIIEDFRERLNDRMVFLENMIFSQIRAWNYDDNQVNQWLELLIKSFNYKLDWANKRVKIMHDFVNNADEFILHHTDLTAIRGFYTIYSETAGFCSAIIDIIHDLQQSLASK